MKELKVVKRGNSLALSLPKSSGFQVNDVWLLIPRSSSKSYVLVPKISNPFANKKPGELYAPEEWQDYNESDVE